MKHPFYRRPFWRRLFQRRRRPGPGLFHRMMAVHMAAAEQGPRGYFERPENR